MSNAAGPTNGRIVLRDGVTEPKSVGIIHCVGSRDRNYNSYCSAICCMQSLKFAHLVGEHTDATVYNFYIDIRAPGKAFDEFYQRVLEEGTIFVRGRVAEVTDALRLPDEADQDGRLIVQVEDTLAGMQRRIPVDMVDPVGRPGAAARRQGDGPPLRDLVQLGRLGDRAAPEARPGRHDDRGRSSPPAARSGPRDIPSSVANGAAAAARILGRIQQKEMSLEPVRASVDESRCSGCRICNDLCPYNAIVFHEDRAVSEVNAALCQGCGTCVAACPAGAMSGTGFSDAQVLAQIEGLLVGHLDRRATPAPSDPRGGAGMNAATRHGAGRRRLRARDPRLHLQLVHATGRPTLPAPPG